MIGSILAIDPGTEKSGWCFFVDGLVLASGVAPNELLLDTVADNPHRAHTLAIERFEARGMAIGDDSIVTIIWAGRFQQAWRSPDAVRLVKRSAVKSFLCGTQKAKDSNIRQALIDKIGAPGTKKAPGPTYGVSSHAWAALGVACTAATWRAA